MNKRLKEKIEKIVSRAPLGVVWQTNELLSLFEEMGKTVIGEDDEPGVSDGYGGDCNELRSEQRIKLKELLGK